MEDEIKEYGITIHWDYSRFRENRDTWWIELCDFLLNEFGGPGDDYVVKFDDDDYITINFKYNDDASTLHSFVRKNIE